MAKRASRHQRSRKKEKSVILREPIELTDYSRAYARRVLRQHGQHMKPGKQSLVVEARLRTPRHRSPCYKRLSFLNFVKVDPQPITLLVGESLLSITLYGFWSTSEHIIVTIPALRKRSPTALQEWIGEVKRSWALAKYLAPK